MTSSLIAPISCGIGQAGHGLHVLQVRLLHIPIVLLRAGTSHVLRLIFRSHIATLLCMAYREKISRHIKVWQNIRPSAGKPDRTHGRMLHVLPVILL